MNDLDVLLEDPVRVIWYLDAHRWPLRLAEAALTRADVRSAMARFSWVVSSSECARIRKILYSLGLRGNWSRLPGNTGFMLGGIYERT